MRKVICLMLAVVVVLGSQALAQGVITSGEHLGGEDTGIGGRGVLQSEDE